MRNVLMYLSFRITITPVMYVATSNLKMADSSPQYVT